MNPTFHFELTFAAQRAADMRQEAARDRQARAAQPTPLRPTFRWPWTRARLHPKPA
ncbi:hypothetical protein [uncultured Deinococcus sp.]|uniref:hypothetical protein n=1 Tax=uncultured Deinococcus sp. TaxID=158789 RepID=UPI002584CC9C|nr:hypothetical protein [uncultured Deinococcus sp.]